VFDRSDTTSTSTTAQENRTTFYKNVASNEDQQERERKNLIATMYLESIYNQVEAKASEGDTVCQEIVKTARIRSRIGDSEVL